MKVVPERRQILVTGMLANFNNVLPEHQKGMTLLEVILVIFIMALLASMVFSSPVFLAQSNTLLGRSSKSDFTGWYQQVRRNALYSSVLGRVCLKGQKMVVQHFTQAGGWQDSPVLYIPPRGVVLSWQSQDCSQEFRLNDKAFVAQITFHISS